VRTPIACLALVLAGLGCVSPPLAEGSEATTTAETDASSTSTSTTSTAETGGFVPESSPDPETCDEWAQDCPAGEKCVPVAIRGEFYQTTTCVPIIGDGGVGDACTYEGVLSGVDSCDASSICWNTVEVDGELVGHCLPFCGNHADDPTCPPGYSCSTASEGVVHVCVQLCDPIAQGCPEGLGCYWSANWFSCMAPVGELGPGEVCGSVTACAAGQICVQSEFVPGCGADACCTVVCELGLGDGPCVVVPGTSCVAFFEEGTAPPGLEHVGVCLSEPP